VLNMADDDDGNDCWKSLEVGSCRSLKVDY
jgi:hypothetical protein